MYDAAASFVPPFAPDTTSARMQAATFEEAMDLCRAGDAERVDKLVKDIYGGDYTKVGLKGEVTASSFGKLSSMDDPKREARQEDLCLALLKMITAQITNLAANIAKLHGVSRVFFVGGFLRFNEISRPQVRPQIPTLPCELSSATRVEWQPWADCVLLQEVLQHSGAVLAARRLSWRDWGTG